MSHFKIERHVESYAERRFSAFEHTIKSVGILGILVAIGYFFASKKDLIGSLGLILFVAMGAFFTSNRKAFKYLQKIEVDEKGVTLTYFIKDQLLIASDDIHSVEMELKNTTTRWSGFNCELILKIKELTIQMEARSDWTYQELYDLFIHFKATKNEKLSPSDKFNLSKMRDKIKG